MPISLFLTVLVADPCVIKNNRLRIRPSRSNEFSTNYSLRCQYGGSTGGRDPTIGCH